MYSASAVDCATISCFLEHQEKKTWTETKAITWCASHIINATNPITKRKSMKIKFYTCLNFMPKSIIPFIYLTIRFVACKWISLAQCMYLESRLTTCTISALLQSNTSSVQSCFCITLHLLFLTPSSLQNFSFLFISVVVGLHSSILNFFTISFAYFCWQMNISCWFWWLPFLWNKTCL